MEVKKFLSNISGRNKARVTEVNDAYLDSLRREKQRIDNHKEKIRLKEEIQEEYRQHNNEHMWGIKRRMDSGHANPDEVAYLKKTQRAALRSAHEGMQKEERLEKQKIYEKKQARINFYNNLGNDVRKIRLKINTPKTSGIQNRFQRQSAPIRTGNILNAQDMFFRKKKNGF